MEWVSGEGICSYEWQTKNGETIRHRDLFGGGASRERGSRPEDVPLVIQDAPTAFLTRRPAGNVIEPHFHEIPQYQIFVEGSGRLGKHGLRPIAVHYTDAYTPYGPIVAGDEGLAFVTLRAQTCNGGAHYMPRSRARMPRKAGRAIAVDAWLGGRGAQPAGHTAHAALFDRREDGVEARLLSLGPHAAGQPDTAQGAGSDRFLLVVSGTLIRDGRELPVYTCVFLPAGEAAPELVAGSSGAEVLVAHFPPAVTHEG